MIPVIWTEEQDDSDCKSYYNLYTFIIFAGDNKVSVQGVVAVGGHFATLCQELDFYEAKPFFSLLIFEKKRQILLHF